MNNQASALIIAKSGQLRNSLHVLITALSQIDQIKHIDDGGAIQIVETALDPVLVVLDFDLSKDNRLTTVAQIKARWPQTRCVVLVNLPAWRACW